MRTTYLDGSITEMMREDGLVLKGTAPDAMVVNLGVIVMTATGKFSGLT